MRVRFFHLITPALLAIVAMFPLARAHAGSGTEELPIPMKTKDAQASDLLYQGKPQDRDDLVDLARKGVDLSKLDPIPNDIWKPEWLPLSNHSKFAYPPDGVEILYLNGLSGNDMSRAQVEYQGRPFRLIVDLENHQALMTAALLRKLGYPVDSPKHYRNLRLRFSNLADLESFMEEYLPEANASADHWVTSFDKENLLLTLQDVNLEYPRLETQQLYNGQIGQDWIDGRRAARALLVPLSLFDVRISSGGVNLFLWEYARIMAEHLIISHPYSSSFAETTYEDLRWVGRKIAVLSRDELRAIIAVGMWPNDIAALLLERIVSRRNDLVQKFGLLGEEYEEAGQHRKIEIYPVDDRLTIGAVKKGEATQEKYPNYAARFMVGDPDSPMRWKELKHYLSMEGIAQGVQAVMSKVNQQIQIRDAADGIAHHQKKVIDDIIEHFKKNPTEPYVMPLRPWAEPLMGFNLNASRSLVTGTYYGSESKAQLVDNFSVGANIGLLGSIDGRKFLQNFAFAANAGYNRTYTHVRPIPSLEAVKKENWKHLFVPGFMRSTGKILTWKTLHRHFLEFRDWFAENQRKLLDANDRYHEDRKTWEAKHAELVRLNGGVPVTCPKEPIASTSEEVKALFYDTFGEAWPKDFPVASTTALPGTLMLKETFIAKVRELSIYSQWTFEKKIAEFTSALERLRQDYRTRRQVFIAQQNAWNALVTRYPERKLVCDPEPTSPVAPDVSRAFSGITGHEWPAQQTIPSFVWERTPEPNTLPKEVEDALVLATLQSFLEDVREDEVFTITDSFMGMVGPQMQIPLTTLMGAGVVDLLGQTLYGQLSPSVGVSLTGQWAITKRLSLMRKGDQIQIYDNKLKTRAYSGDTNFTAWIELARLGLKKKGGNADTQALMLDLSPITDADKAAQPEFADDRKKLLNVLHELFIKNETDQAAAYSPSFQLTHHFKGFLKSAKLLLKTWASYNETHKVKVEPTRDELGRAEYGNDSHVLYSARKMNLNGSNPYGLVGQILSKAVGIPGLFSSGPNLNPSSTFLGVSDWRQVRAEADITENQEFKPTVTFEYRHAGWFLSREKVLALLDHIQASVQKLNLDAPIFRRSMFAQMSRLEAYEVRSNVVIYPSGVRKLEEILPKEKRAVLLQVLMDLTDPADYRPTCKTFLANEKTVETELARTEELSDEAFAQQYRGTLWSNCIQPWMRRSIRHIRHRPETTNKEKYVRWLADTMYLLDTHVDVSRFLGKIGKENFFMQVKVSGFRKGDEAAVTNSQVADYTTDTIGTLQTPISLGAFRDLEVYTKGLKWKLSDYELQGRYFGDGL